MSDVHHNHSRTIGDTDSFADNVGATNGRAEESKEEARAEAQGPRGEGSADELGSPLNGDLRDGATDG